MIGHKYNLKELLHDLASEEIKHTYTEFCQGRVTRWGLAWTHQNYDIYKLVPPRDKLRKKCLPIVYQLTELPNQTFSIDTCYEKIKEILTKLEIEMKIICKKIKSVSMHINADKNTWSHQRRKRRLLKRQEEQEAKKNRHELTSNESSPNESFERIQGDTLKSDKSVNHNNNCAEQVSQTEKDLATQQPILQAFLKILKKDDAILLEIEYLDGSAGKEGLHQIVQYIKNNWK